jgi:hypothetical protein
MNQFTWREGMHSRVKQYDAITIVAP